MDDSVEADVFRFIPHELVLSIERAAAREGRAEAMVVSMMCEWQNYDKSKVPIWEAEQEAWSSRKDELLSRVSLQKDKISDYAARIVANSFTTTLVM
jgi:hypothetical protein